MVNLGLSALSIQLLDEVYINKMFVPTHELSE